jgi:hypothetical protein
LESREYKKSPTTTVGSERSVLKKVMTGLLRKNSRVLIKNPRGIPTMEARRVAVREILRESRTVRLTSLSKLMIRRMASLIPSQRYSIVIVGF